jgi:hypothetical protein
VLSGIKCQPFILKVKNTYFLAISFSMWRRQGLAYLQFSLTLNMTIFMPSSASYLVVVVTIKKKAILHNVQNGMVLNHAQ